MPKQLNFEYFLMSAFHITFGKKKMLTQIASWKNNREQKKEPIFNTKA
jgi:hypothetical protein